MSITDIVPPGVVTGDNLVKLLEHARDNGYAIPAVNCTSSSTANACLEAAAKNNSPVMIQVSNGGGKFMTGKSISEASGAVAGSVALAYHVRAVAKYYGIPVVLHSDHCAKKLLPWFDGMLEADKDYFEKFGEPLFSSHMLDLSEETDEENIAICVKYFKEFAPMKLWLEMEIGITGGEEDGVNNENVDPEKLYTTPEQVYSVYQALSAIGPMFSIAAAFGNVHGVYKPGNVTLSPEKLLTHQEYTKEKIGSDLERPIFLVMHGGSGSTEDEIKLAVKNGVIKMNIDTDTQWAYWEGTGKFVEEKKEYLKGQIGNPDGPEKPNKKYYDPRVWIRKGEESMIARVGVSMQRLGSVGAYPRSKEPGRAQLGLEKKTLSSAAVLSIGVAIGAVGSFVATTILKKK